MKASIISLSYIYICSRRYHGTFLTRPDQQDVTSVLPVIGCTSAGEGAIHWVQVATTGLQAAACLGVVGGTDGCAVGAVGAL